MEDEKTRVTFGGCGGWPGTLLTAVIIAIRAFQTNAEPMSQWSVWSWVLMTLPCTVPVLFAAMALLFCIVAAVAGSSGKRW